MGQFESIMVGDFEIILVGNFEVIIRGNYVLLYIFFLLGVPLSGRALQGYRP